MKNLLQAHVAEEIITRMQHLKPESNRRWGTLDAAAMLRHCNEANRSILENKLPNLPTTRKQRMIRFLCFYVLRKFPKNVQVKSNVHAPSDAPDFHAEQQKFTEIIRDFAANDCPILLSHPAFGRLTTKQWGVSTWMHMDHHLRQFGV